MDLFEYQGKQYFARFGIPISTGRGGRHGRRGRRAGRGGRLPGGGQGAGQGGRPRQGRRRQAGRRRRRGAPPRRQHPRLDIKGHVVKRLWVEHASDIAKEYYASFTLDRAAKQHLGMLSAEGGVEIEEVAATNPDAIARLHIDPVDGLARGGGRASGSTGPTSTPRPATRPPTLLVELYHCYVEGDCDLAEINPLILTPEGKVHALDAKVTLDDNAAFRHPEWEEFAGTTSTSTSARRWPRRRASTTSASPASVGIIANGAGLAMSTLDVVNQVRRRRRPTSSTSAAAPTPT